MKTTLRRLSMILTLAGLLAGHPGGTAALAQEDGASDGRKPPERSQPLTDEQKASVKAILARYNPEALTAADAKAIHRAFHDAGVAGGPSEHAAVREAGFDPEVLRELDPPPGGGGRRGGPGRDRTGGPSGQTEGAPPERPSGDETPAAGDSARPAASGAARSERPPRGSGQGARGYSIEQAVSDNAQLHTIAFGALAFLSGDLCSDSFLPPGKVSDFFGFQYMRDIDQGSGGHNTSFLPRIANNLLAVLDEGQRAQLVALSAEQVAPIRELALKRFPLMKAFRRLLEGDLPAGTSGLDKAAVMAHSAGVFEQDGLLAYQRARMMGDVIRSLSAEQKAALAKLVFGDSRTWPDVGDIVDKRSMSHSAHVAVMTYASEMFSWYAGSVEADTYFCPERHGTYFGGFYLKDAPAMGNPGYSISTSLTGDGGKNLLQALDATQRGLITGLVEQQRAALLESVATRRAISTELRRFMTGPMADQAKVLALSRRYGELDGELSCYYATAFARVGRSLSSEQRDAVAKLRNLDGFPCRGAYLYSDNVELPSIGDTDFLFK